MRLRLCNVFSSFLQLLLLTHALLPFQALAKPASRPEKEGTPYVFEGEADQLPEAYAVLVYCPGITDLTLKIHASDDPTKCIAPWGFQFRQGDRFPPLRNMTLGGYMFEDGALQQVSQSQRLLQAQRYFRETWDRARMTLFGAPAPEYNHNLERWLQAMDWTQLERLSLSGRDFFWQRMKYELPSLRHLKTGIRDFSEPLVNFLRSVPPLESLSLHNYNPTLDNSSTLSCAPFKLDRILPRHSATLRDLRIYQQSSKTPGYRRLACNNGEIASLHRLVPHLTHLTLDMDRDEHFPESHWPNLTFAALGTWKDLTSLHLRLELGTHGHARSRDDYIFNADGLVTGGPFGPDPRTIDSGVAEDMFRRLRCLKKGASLKRLELEVGDLDTPPWMADFYAIHIDTDRPRKFICEEGRLRAIDAQGGWNGTEESAVCQTLDPWVVYQ